jgi:hypothetical protein
MVCCIVHSIVSNENVKQQQQSLLVYKLSPRTRAQKKITVPWLEQLRAAETERAAAIWESTHQTQNRREGSWKKAKRLCAQCLEGRCITIGHLEETIAWRWAQLAAQVHPEPQRRLPHFVADVAGTFPFFRFASHVASRPSRIHSHTSLRVSATIVKPRVSWTN